MCMVSIGNHSFCFSYIVKILKVPDISKFFSSFFLWLPGNVLILNKLFFNSLIINALVKLVYFVSSSLIYIKVRKKLEIPKFIP